jgi:hypothetical protein
VTGLQRVGGIDALVQGIGLIPQPVIFFGVLPAQGVSVVDLADPAKALPLATGLPLLFFWPTIIAGALTCPSRLWLPCPGICGSGSSSCVIENAPRSCRRFPSIEVPSRRALSAVFHP